MEGNKTYGEKAWQQLHKNAVSSTEQVQEATPHKRAGVRPPTTHHENYLRILYYFPMNERENRCIQAFTTGISPNWNVVSSLIIILSAGSIFYNDILYAMLSFTDMRDTAGEVRTNT